MRKGNMYDILKEAVYRMKAQGTNTVICTCPVHGDFTVYAV